MSLILVVLFATPVSSQDSAENSQNSSIVELGAPEEPLPCGNRPIAIVQMQWPSSIILAHIHGEILIQEFGCDVTYISGDMAATASSMATIGEPAIAPEMWVTRIAPIWNSVLETERIRSEGASFVSTGFEGWYVPAHIATRVPALKRASELTENLSLIAGAEETPVAQSVDESSATQEQTPAPVEKIRFISCPVDWACALINKNLLAAYGLSNFVDLVEPANRFEMDTLIGQVVSNKLPAIFYYWQPNAVLAQFEFMALDMGAFDEEAFKCLAQASCADPQPSSFSVEKPFIVTADWLSEEAPVVLRYLRRSALPIEEMNKILNWQSEGEIEFEELAKRFVREREMIWRPWIDGLQ